MVTAALVAVFAAAAAAGAQEPMQPPDAGTHGAVRHAHHASHTDLSAHLNAAAINAAIGGVMGGVAQHLRGGSFTDGFARGTLGGATWYAGKWVATRDFSGSGLAGRQVAALGSSIVANATTNAGLLDRFVLPFGPVRLSFDLRQERWLEPRLDVPHLVAVAWAVSQPHVTIDWSRTMASGTTVLIDRSPATYWAGRHAAGVIMLKDQELDENNWLTDIDRVLRHEQVHVLQHDFTAHVWGRPAASRLLRGVPGASALHRYIDVRLDLAAWAAANWMLPHADRPWEREAYLLTGARSGRIVDVRHDRGW